jgi:hypothetical protein
VGQDGRIENVPTRPICTLAVPPGLKHNAKQPVPSFTVIEDQTHQTTIRHHI